MKTYYSFETEYYAKKKGDVNSDVMVCMRMYCTQKVASFPGHSQISLTALFLHSSEIDLRVLWE